MEQNRIRELAVIVLGGFAFYYLHSNLVGLAAALAAPDWFLPFVRENQDIGLVLFALVTTIPAAAIGAGISGFVLSRFVDARYFLTGLLIVCVAILAATVSVDHGFGFLGDVRRNALPSRWMDVPMMVALWLFLPLAMVFFGNCKERGRD